jgi:hypothetical protein
MAACARSGRARSVRGLVAAAVVLPVLCTVSAHAGPPRPVLKLARSSVVDFEVRHTERMVNAEQFGGTPKDWIQLLAPSSERYAAVYFPAANAGWVQVQDPDAPTDPPLVAPIGTVRQRGFSFKPHHRYSMVVALAKPARLVLPSPNYKVLGVRHRDLVGVTLAIYPLPVPGGSGAAVSGFARSTLASSQASMVALSVDYQQASDRITSGDACLAPAPSYPCAFDRSGAFRAGWWTEGAHGQDTVGRAYKSPPSGDYLTGDFEVLYGSDFQAARLVAFGLRYNQ